MIALHLDGTYPEYDTWRELAVCFLQLHQSEEDRVSRACSIGTGGHKLVSSLNINSNIKLLTEKNSRNTWRLRCRWWLTRHFGHKITPETSVVGELSINRMTVMSFGLWDENMYSLHPMNEDSFNM